MTVTDLGLNRHEKGIVKAIEQTMPEGIHVQGLVKDFGISPTTLNQYLSVLENERKIIYHEKIKNKNVYRIREFNESSFNETQTILLKSISDFESTINLAIDHASRWGIAERLEVYQHVVNLLALLRYAHQIRIDVEGYDGKSIPNDLKNYMDGLDRISSDVNTRMDGLLHTFFRVQLDNTISESFKFLKNIPKAKKRKAIKAH